MKKSEIAINHPFKNVGFFSFSTYHPYLQCFPLIQHLSVKIRKSTLKYPSVFQLMKECF